MWELTQFAGLKLRLAVRTVRIFLTGSKLRSAVVGCAAVVFWLLMFGMFFDVFHFLGRFPGIADIITNYLFAFFFLALLVMMTISNAIICYISFYRNDEAAFLLAMPIRAESIFTYKGIESILFSAWGMGILVVPMILAYGITQHSPWYFYVLSLTLALLMMGLPMAGGAVTALLVPLVVPRRRKIVLALFVVAGAGLVILWGFSMLAQRPTRILTETGFKHIMNRIAFCQHWALPSYWVSEGILASARAVPRRSVFLLLLLLSNVMFLGLATLRLGKALYLRSWASAHQGGQESRPIKADSVLDRVLEGALFFLRGKLRLLVLKDVKTFRRDPAQWSQCLLFFGLLALYILNLPRFGFAALAPYWHSLVSLLNLGATCLTLSTLTSRFVYPQLSLEGRRIWIIGLVPMRRRTVLWSKFLFAAAGSVLVSGGLIALSDVMLGLASWTIALHMVVVLCVCCGLNGLAVGLGAVYPNMRSDNPSHIVSSFGGTLNLVCSILFILAAVILIAVPLHLHAVGKLVGPNFTLALAICLSLEVALASLTCLVPMTAGVHAFERMEF